MDIGKVIKEAKAIMIATLVLGLALLAAGIALSVLDIGFLPNDKAIVGLSFIPLAVSLAYYVKIRSLRKSPREMRPLVIRETDERLVAHKNEADAKAFRILQGALFLAYMGYTLSVPADIFESAGWWILFGLLALSFLSQAILMMRIMRRDKSDRHEPENRD